MTKILSHKNDNEKVETETYRQWTDTTQS